MSLDFRHVYAANFNVELRSYIKLCSCGRTFIKTITHIIIGHCSKQARTQVAAVYVMQNLTFDDQKNAIRNPKGPVCRRVDCGWMPAHKIKHKFVEWQNWDVCIRKKDTALISITPARAVCRPDNLITRFNHAYSCRHAFIFFLFLRK